MHQVRWFMAPSCGEIVEIKSVISNAVWGSPHDETAVVALRFASGATAEFCSSVLFEAPTRLEVYGSRGYAVCTGTLGPHGGGAIQTHAGPLAFDAVDPYAAEIADFVEAVTTGRPPEVDGLEGLRNVEILERITV